MKTLHLGLRVADLDRSLAFYTSVGYEVVQEVAQTDLGHRPQGEPGHLRCSEDPRRAQP